MVVGEGQRQHQLRLEARTIPDRLHGRLGDPKNRHFRAVDDRREVGAADVAQAGDGEAGALHGVGSELLVARLVGQFGRFGCQLQQALLVDITDHRHQQAVRGVDGKADMHVFLLDQLLAVAGQRDVEVRLLTQQMSTGLEQEGQYGQFDAGLLGSRLLVLAEGFQRADVGQVELGDMRHVEPAAVQVAGADLLQAGHVDGFDLAKPREVDLRHRRDTAASDGAGGRCLALLHDGLHVFLHVFLEDAITRTGGLDVGQVDTELAGQHPYRRTGVYLGAFAAGAADRRWAGRLFAGLVAAGSGGGLLGVTLLALLLSGLRLCLGLAVAATDLHLHDHIAGLDVLLQLDIDRLDHAREWRGQLHAGLVRLQHQQ